MNIVLEQYKNKMALISWLVCAMYLLNTVWAKGSPSQVECTPEIMTVVIPMDGDRKFSYLDSLKDYTPCEPSVVGSDAVFRLDLDDPHKCGVTRVLNKLTGKRVFYHKVVVEGTLGREVITVKCVVVPSVPAPQVRGIPHAIARRDVELPAGFQEPEDLQITDSFTRQAPEPHLGVVVKQAGKKVSGEISVNPGTPLSMEIFLDNSSAPVYGLMAGYMQVTDTKSQQETIIFNGCSVDPYLFDNFVTEDGDILTAKFRAFKFPDTTYVQFKGTVTVCLDKCQGVPCSNGVVGYGRRRRSIESSADPNRVYEVSLTTFIKVDYLDGNREADDITKLLRNLQMANEKLDQHSNRTHLGDSHPATVRERTEDFQYKHMHPAASLAVAASANLISCLLLVSVALIAFIRI